MSSARDRVWAPAQGCGRRPVSCARRPHFQGRTLGPAPAGSRLLPRLPEHVSGMQGAPELPLLA